MQSAQTGLMRLCKPALLGSHAHRAVFELCRMLVCAAVQRRLCYTVLRGWTARMLCVWVQTCAPDRTVSVSFDGRCMLVVGDSVSRHVCSCVAKGLWVRDARYSGPPWLQHVGVMALTARRRASQPATVPIA